MEYIGKYPDKYFDLGVLDPPYGIGISNSKHIGKRGKSYSTTTYTRSNWDDQTPGAEYFSEMQRICKTLIIWGGNYFSEFLPVSKSWIVWVKNQPEDISFGMAELAWTNSEKSTQVFTYSLSRSKNSVSNNRHKATGAARIHPTQKPVPLYAWIYRKYSAPGMRVIDTHLGSFSSAIAATGAEFAEFTGFEIDKAIFTRGLKRYTDSLKQQKILFV